jgi:hypothetical protein
MQARASRRNGWASDAKLLAPRSHEQALATLIEEEFEQKADLSPNVVPLVRNPNICLFDHKLRLMISDPSPV